MKKLRKKLALLQNRGWFSKAKFCKCANARWQKKAAGKKNKFWLGNVKYFQRNDS